MRTALMELRDQSKKTITNTTAPAPSVTRTNAPS